MHIYAMNMQAHHDQLLGIGLYTPSEAGRLIGVPSSKITRWLKGHAANGRKYEPLWTPQISLNDGSVHLGFRDLIEARTAKQFIMAGLSPQSVRRAIQIAREVIGVDRPLSTSAFRTDGRSIFLEQTNLDGETRLLDLLKGQFTFPKIMERSLRGIEFDGIEPSLWRPLGKPGGIVVDPARAFGQPVEVESGIPTSVLKAAFDGRQQDASTVARDWEISVKSVNRAIVFEQGIANAQCQ